jgi:hypothetical protein
MVRQLLREPLLHFFVLGAGLFVLFASLDRGAMQAPAEVVVDPSRIDGLVAQFERTWQRPPTPDEVRDLVDGWVREEILYREGIALGLDVDDSIIRQRVAQKMAFIADGAAPPEPTDDELEEWLQAHADGYRIEPAYSLQQLYFDPARHGAGLPARLQQLASALDDDTAPPEGDATLLPARVRSAGAGEVMRTFGAEFAAALPDLPVGEWHGPVPSAYGLHLIRVESMTPGRQPTLDEVRALVERDWSAAEAERMNEAFYQTVRARYTVRMTEDAASLAGSASSNPR